MTMEETSIVHFARASMAVVYHNSCDPWAYLVDECERYETKIVAGRFKEDHLVFDRRGVT